ncbi:hypothetical protein ACFY0F_02840 [Streptomyces sp. NPDC001544]|uniref:hypothetical protein n=1 Tax=Streptomyces sp. NPDC001544 TaxID=3364584 RepID=UPI0036C75486
MARRSITPGRGCGGCLGLLFGWPFVGYLLLLPITLPALLADQKHGPRTTTPAQEAVLWLVSALVVLALAWAAQGRRRPKPLLLLTHTALLSCAAALAAWGATRVNRSITANLRAHPSGGAGSPTELPWSFTATLETVAAAFAVAMTFHAIRWWCRRDDPPPRVVIHGPRPGTDRPGSTEREVRRPRPGEIWLAHIPKREDESDTLRHYCVIVRNRASYAEVMQITSQDKTGWRDFIPFPNDGWDHTEREHWLEVALPPRRVPYGSFLKPTPQGDCPEGAWEAITQIMSRAEGRHRTTKNRAGRSTGGQRQKQQGAGGNRKTRRPPRPPQGSGRSAKPG